MQIEIDFDVFKALTTLRRSEADSYNSVLRRLLELPIQNALAQFADAPPRGVLGGVNALLRSGLPPGTPHDRFGTNALAGALGGTWFNGIHFPEGTQFRATYKGATYLASISEGRWVGHDGIVRTSPSDAASAISGTNVNGWRFWHVLRPGDETWVRMDSLRS